MKITKVNVKPILLPLKVPFKIALGEDVEYEGVVVEIETDNGLTGIGEISPSHRITGETVGASISIMQTDIIPQIMDENPLFIEKLMDKVNARIIFNPSVKCAVDIALHDILGKYLGMPLKTILGGFRESITTSITIGIKSIPETIEEGKSFVTNGAKVIKVKIGLTPEEDIEKIRLLREELGYKIAIRIDANQGYEPRTAVKVLRQLEKYEIEFVEQPVAYWDIKGLKFVKNNTDIPVMADESIHSIYDAINLIHEEACDLFNIKLMKAGGIKAGAKIAAIAESAGIPCMIGCMVETKIGIAAATHLALATKNIKYADLDGHLMLRKDVVEGGVFTENGENKVTEKSGLGVTMIENN
ncbi:MAG: dipeptide epimerase [bacterium]|nr:dipeptide epimerase [bacterium]